MSLEILLNLGERPSLASQLNLYVKEDNLILMDNHRAAFWAWLQLDLTKSYNLIHIDRHYDLSPYFEERHSSIKQFQNLGEISLKEFSELTYMQGIRVTHPIVTWDNYINIFNEVFPNFLSFTYFITEKEGSFLFSNKYKEIELYDLMEMHIENDRKYILNLDLDYFFTKDSYGNPFQKYTDNYINLFADWIVSERDNFEQIIICLSPECCGGWNNSKKIAKLILNKLGSKITSID